MVDRGGRRVLLVVVRPVLWVAGGWKGSQGGDARYSWRVALPEVKVKNARGLSVVGVGRVECKESEQHQRRQQDR